MTVWTIEEVEREAWFGGQKERVLATVRELNEARIEIDRSESAGHRALVDLATEREANKLEVEALQASLTASQLAHRETAAERDSLVMEMGVLLAKTVNLRDFVDVKAERDRLREALKRHSQLAKTLAATADGPYTPEHLARRLAEADAALKKKYLGV